MKIIYIMSFYLGLVSFLFAKEGAHICYFSLNNEKEFLEMGKFLGKLNKVSNTPISISEFQTLNSDPNKSFEKMIQSGAKCDGLVISGHHTGAFGGKLAEGSLNLDFMEKLSCNPKYKAFFENIKAVWLQGCRTLGQKIVSDEREAEGGGMTGEAEVNADNCQSADCHRERVGAVLVEDNLTQSFAELEMEFSDTLDQDNPLSTRYLRIYPRAGLFGWTKSAPGVKWKSELSIPYHIAHISRLIDDRKEFFEDPSSNFSDLTAAHYARAILGLLQGGNPELAPCFAIEEEIGVEAWLYHGRAKLIAGRPLPFSFNNSDLLAFPSLSSTGNTMLKRAKELDCLLKKRLTNTQLNDVLDEVLSDEKLLGYNLNALHALDKKLAVENDLTRSKLYREKLARSPNLERLLMRKLKSKETGTLRKIDYFAFYRNIGQQNFSEVEKIIKETAFNFLTEEIKESEIGRRDYFATLFISLLKNDVLQNEDIFELVQQTKNSIALDAVARGISCTG